VRDEGAGIMTVLEGRALLLDLDGVLVDSTGSISRSWTRWATGHELDPVATLKLGHGIRTLDHIRLVAPHLDWEAEAAALEALEIEAATNDRAYAGAAELIEQVMGGPWAIVTSCTRPLALARLQSAGLPIPATLVCGDDVSASKPDPEGYLLGARLLGAAPSETIVVEDAPAGIAAARAAGTLVLAVASTHAASELADADAVADGLDEITITRPAGYLRVYVEHSLTAGRAQGPPGPSDFD
jgi:sugar-phosphatase